MGLLERADSASTPTNLPNLERTVTFRVLDSAPRPQQESLTLVVIQRAGRRDQLTFGSFLLLNVYARGAIHDKVVQQSESPNLNANALSIIHEQTFTPAFCSGKPNASRGSFVLNFR